MMRFLSVLILLAFCLPNVLWGQALSPSYTLTAADFQAMVSDQPPSIQKALLADPARFLEDYKPLLNAAWDQLVLVDKKHELPSDYEAKDLVNLKTYKELSQSRGDLKFRKAYMPQVLALDKALKKDGLRLVFSSSYRSWVYQRDLFQHYVNKDGIATADRYSARAGRSQHQLGTVFDFGSITPEFAATPEGKWLAAHAEDYGFSLSYPDGYEELTGYTYEPWHFRYIGAEACKVQKLWFGDLQQYLLEFNNAHGEDLKKALKKSN